MPDPAKPLEWDDDDSASEPDWLDTDAAPSVPDACDLDDPDCDACQ